MSNFNDLFGPEYYSKKGFVAEVGECEFEHRFGGDSWKIIDDEKISYGPTLLLNLDLNDPLLKELKFNGVDSIPFCAYLNCVAIDRQLYTFDSKQRIIKYVCKKVVGRELLPDYVLFPNPLPEKKLRLKNMDMSDYPLNEDMYWECTSEFTGGHNTIRVLGPPIWMQDITEETCSCGKRMEYICGIGYEVENEQRQLMDDRPFFPGEMAHYFFLCRNCSKILVALQST